MPKLQSSSVLLIISGLIGLILCAGLALTGVSGGVAYWLLTGDNPTPPPTRRPAVIAALPTATPIPPTATATETPTPTPTPVPTETPAPTATPPPSATPEPTATPTETPVPAPIIPTATPPPTETFTPEPPAFPFIIKEQAVFETTHQNFDVYIAIVNGDNGPLAGYKVIGTHSSGLVVESQPSAGDWTVNSGAKHYKGGNLKFEAPNSPGGVWSMQLIDPEGRPAAPPAEMPFDADHPTWHFIIFEHHADSW